LADEAEAGQNQPAGKSRGGMTTKILALADGLGSLVRFAPVPGQRGEITGAEKSIEAYLLALFWRTRLMTRTHFATC
jgi:hypothetical protein